MKMPLLNAWMRTGFWGLCSFGQEDLRLLVRCACLLIRKFRSSSVAKEILEPTIVHISQGPHFVTHV